MKKLFDIKFKEIKALSGVHALSTPLGKIIADVALDKTVLSKILPTRAGKVSKGAFLYAWELTSFYIELLKVHFVPSIPLKMEVDGCVAFLWRFQCLIEGASLQFYCYLENSEGGVPRSGERLIAQTWENETMNLVIGTEDDEALLSRANHQKGLPFRFATENCIDFNLIDYLKNGIRVSLPPFLKGEQGQIQFVTAWMKLNGRNEEATWFAVDTSAEEILKLLQNS